MCASRRATRLGHRTDVFLAPSGLSGRDQSMPSVASFGREIVGTATAGGNVEPLGEEGEA